MCMVDLGCLGQGGLPRNHFTLRVVDICYTQSNESGNLCISAASPTTSDNSSLTVSGGCRGNFDLRGVAPRRPQLPGLPPAPGHRVLLQQALRPVRRRCPGQLPGWGGERRRRVGGAPPPSPAPDGMLPGLSQCPLMSHEQASETFSISRFGWACDGTATYEQRTDMLFQLYACLSDISH